MCRGSGVLGGLGVCEKRFSAKEYRFEPSGLAAVPPPELMYILRPTCTPPQPLGLTVSMSYSPTMRKGVARLSMTNIPPPRSVTNVNRLEESMIGQMGALSG